MIGKQRIHLDNSTANLGFIICLLVLSMTVFAVSVSYQSVTTDHHDEEAADQLWANALWYAYLAFEDDIHEEEMGRSFASAISTAKHKAPIYVSFGVNDSGGWRLNSVLEEAVLSAVIEEDFDSTHTSNPKSWRDKFQSQLRRSLSKAITGDTLEGHFDDIQTLMTSGTDTSLLCFQAAIAEDPTYLPARFYLALYSEGELKAKSLSEWATIDEQNALPLYLRAETMWNIEYDEFGESIIGVSGDYQKALSLIELANEKPFVRSYSVDWPSASPNAEWNLVPSLTQKFPVLKDKPVTLLALKNWSKIINEKTRMLSPSASWKVFELGRRLRKLARYLVTNNQPSMAKRVLKAMYKLGIRLHQIEGEQRFNSYEGIFLMAYALRSTDTNNSYILEIPLRDRIEIRNQSASVSKLVIFRMTFLKQNFPEIMSGKIDFEEWDRNFFNHYHKDPPRWFDYFPAHH